MKSREQSLFAGLLQKQNRTQLAIILGVAAMLLILFSELFSTPQKPQQMQAVLLLFQKLPTGSNWKHS